MGSLRRLWWLRARMRSFWWLRWQREMSHNMLGGIFNLQIARHFHVLLQFCSTVLGEENVGRRKTCSWLPRFSPRLCGKERRIFFCPLLVCGLHGWRFFLALLILIGTRQIYHVWLP